MGMFDDLVPQGATAPARGGMFDDLIPTAPAAERPQRSELEQRMDARVAKEAERGLTPSPNAAQYTPIGSWLDEASAYIDAGLNKVTGGAVGQPYDEAKAYQDARQRYIDENVGGLRKGAAVAGGIVASAPMGAVNLFRGTTLLPQIGNAAATGAAYGALYGAGEGEGMERVANAGQGAVIGAGIGAAAAPVARAVGNAAGYLRNRSAPASGPLAGMERRAINSVADDMQSSGVDAGRYASQASDLGPQGMLADMGEDLTLTTNALANTNGPQMPIVRRALQERQADAPQRVKDLASQTFGTPRDIPAYLEASKKGYQQAAKPYYDAFYATPIKPDDELTAIIQAMPDETWAQAQKLMRSERIDPASVQNTGRGIDLMKRALDDVIRGTKQGTNEFRVYSNLSRDLVNKVDSLLSPADPSQSAWAIGRKIWQPGAQEREALDTGRKVFSGKMRPYDLNAELKGASAAEQRGIKMGARDDLNTMMGRASSNFGPKGDTAARRALNSEFAQENAALIAGPQKAAALTRGINAENRMAETFNEIMSNSATAKRTAAQRRLPMSTEKPLGDNQPRTLSELAFVAGRKVLNAVLAGGLNERAGRIMADQARLLTARGIERDQFAQALLQLGQHRAMTPAKREAIIKTVNILLSSGRAPVIESATSSRASP